MTVCWLKTKRFGINIRGCCRGAMRENDFDVSTACEHVLFVNCPATTGVKDTWLGQLKAQTVTPGRSSL